MCLNLLGVLDALAYIADLTVLTQHITSTIGQWYDIIFGEYIVQKLSCIHFDVRTSVSNECGNMCHGFDEHFNSWVQRR